MKIEVRTMNNLYTVQSTPTGGIEVKGHPVFCPDFKPVDYIHLNNVMFVQFTDGTCIRTSLVQQTHIIPFPPSVNEGTRAVPVDQPPLCVHPE